MLSLELYNPVTGYYSMLGLTEVTVVSSGFMSLFQKDKNGIVMVNFYNDYVTCSPKANLSHVAGESDTQ